MHYEELSARFGNPARSSPCHHGRAITSSTMDQLVHARSRQLTLSWVARTPAFGAPRGFHRFAVVEPKLDDGIPEGLRTVTGGSKVLDVAPHRLDRHGERAVHVAEISSELFVSPIGAPMAYDDEL